MRTFLIAAAAVAALGCASAHAGEGNGPSFPGLQAISTGVTTSSATPDAPSVATTTLLNSANANFQALPVRGVVLTRPQRMIATLSGANAS